MSWESRVFLLQYQDFLDLKSDFPHLKSNFPCTKSDLPKSAFYFLWLLSAFFNGFPRSPTAFRISPTTFRFYSTASRFPRKSISGEKYTKDRYSSFVFFATHSPSFVITHKQYLRDYPTLCLYLKGGNKLNVGIVWFEGKAPSRTYKTCFTVMEPFAGPSSMAISNQPMPSRYPLCKRLSEGGVRGFLLTLWSGGEMIFFSKHIDFVLI